MSLKELYLSRIHEKLSATNIIPDITQLITDYCSKYLEGKCIHVLHYHSVGILDLLTLPNNALVAESVDRTMSYWENNIRIHHAKENYISDSVTSFAILSDGVIVTANSNTITISYLKKKNLYIKFLILTNI